MINVGEKLRKERNSKQYSLEYVALKLNVNIATILRMEKGNKRLCLKLFSRYCQLLDISPETVFSENIRSNNDKIALQIGYLILNELNQSLPYILSQIFDSEAFVALIKEWKSDGNSQIQM